MAINKTEAIVLNKRDFRETSIIASFYTRDFGKMTGLLKGIRQEPGKFASAVEPFSYNEIVFYEKRQSPLHLVSQCDLKKDYRLIKANLERIKKAFLLLELIDVLTAEEDRNENIFDLAVSCLEQMDNHCDLDKILITLT